MRRLREIRDNLVENGNIPRSNFSSHVFGTKQDPLESETESGIELFVDCYDGAIYIEDVTEKEYENIRLLLYEWFRENRNEGETFDISGDFISDVVSSINIDVSLCESVHIVPDPDGKIERNGQFWSLANPSQGGFI